MMLTYFLIAFVCLYALTGLSSPRCRFIKLKVCNQIQFFTLDFIYICDELIGFQFSFLCKFYTILIYKFFHCISLILSGDVILNSGPVCISQPSYSNEWNVFSKRNPSNPLEC